MKIRLENKIFLFSLLASHNDGTIIDDVRHKMALMFRQEVRPYVTGELASRKDVENFHKTASGIFGG